MQQMQQKDLKINGMLFLRLFQNCTTNSYDLCNTVA
jgi:hypothetical protein